MDCKLCIVMYYKFFYLFIFQVTINSQATIVVQCLHAVVTLQGRIAFMFSRIYTKLQKMFSTCKNDRIYVIHTEVNVKREEKKGNIQREHNLCESKLENSNFSNNHKEYSNHH